MVDHERRGRLRPVLALLTVAALAMGCTGGPAGTATAAPTATPAPSESVAATASPTAAASPTATPPAFSLADVPGIVDPDNLGWPRVVDTSKGRVTIESQPLRIHTLSLGLDEVTLGLVPPERVVAVGSFTKDPAYSNVADLVGDATTVGRDAEQIIAVTPDVVLASPFANADLLAALATADVTVVQTELRNDPVGRIQDVLFLGYVLGEEERGLALAAEIAERQDGLAAQVEPLAAAGRPSVLAITRFSDEINVAGDTTTEDAIIELAGGSNAADAIDGHQTIDREGVISTAPEAIIIPQSLDDAELFKADLLADVALAAVPAIAEERVYPVSPRLYQTLSFWNLLGAEELARTLWPEDLADLESPPFSRPSPGG